MVSSLEMLDQLSVDGTPLRRELCTALANLMQRMAGEQQRAMAQVWLPGFTSEGVLALSCQGAPYAIAGEGDLCALFRCVSCRYIFYPSAPDIPARGSIGRVFQSHKPEISNNVAGAPAQYYHRAAAARKCLLHSLAVMPLWMPAVSRRAPVAVLEILQPDTQPDFDALQCMVVSALQQVRITQCTVVAPMPDAFEGMINPAASSADAPNAGSNASGSTDQKPSGSRGARAPRAGGGPEGAGDVDGDGDVQGSDSRMMMVFDDRTVATDSGEHVDNVIRKMVTRPSIPVSMTGNGTHANTREFAVQVLGRGNSRSVSSGRLSGGKPNVTGSNHASASGAASDVEDDAANEAVSGRGQQQDVQCEASSLKSEPRYGLARTSTNHVGAASDDLLTPRAGPSRRALSTGGASTVARGSPDKPSHVPQSNSDEKNLKEAMDLLAVVEDDKGWQTATTTGGSLRGGSAALMACINSEKSGVDVGDSMHEGSKRKRRAHPDSALMPPPRAASPSPAAAGGAAAGAASGPAAPAAAQMPARRDFSHSGCGTFVRAGGTTRSAQPAVATLDDKIARAEGLLADSATPSGCTGANVLPPAAALLAGGPVAPPAGVPKPLNAVPSLGAVSMAPVGGVAAPMVGMPAAHPVLSSTELTPGSSLHNGSLYNGTSVHGARAASQQPETEEQRKARNRANRVDGGIGRKLTMDMLAPHFGKGLKEAAEALGMCPTTLKRACRRLGINRWPRRPEAAAQVLGTVTTAAGVTVAAGPSAMPNAPAAAAGAAATAGTSALEGALSEPDFDLASGDEIMQGDMEGLDQLFEMLDVPQTVS